MDLKGVIGSPYRFPFNFTKDYLRPSHWKSAVLFIYNRIRYGFSYHDGWSLDHYLSTILCKGIEQLYEGYGYPGHLESMEEWQAILADMHEGFYLHATFWDWFGEKGYEEKEKLMQEKLDRSLDLLKEYYQCMWD